MVKEAEANPNHRLYTLHGNYLEHLLVEKALEAVQGKMTAFVEENDKWANLHQRATALLASGQLAKWLEAVSEASSSASASLASCSSADLVSDFLSKAGQTTLVDQFQAVERAFAIGLGKLRARLRDLLLMLDKYASLASLYPQSSRASHRCHLYSKWTRALLADLSVSHAQELVNDFTRRFVEGGETEEERRTRDAHLLAVNYQLEGWVQGVAARKQALTARMAALDPHARGKREPAVFAEMNVAFGDLQESIQRESVAVRSLILDLFLPRLSSACGRLLSLEETFSEAGPSPEALPSSDGSPWPLVDELFMEVGVSAQLLEMMSLFGLDSGSFQSQESLSGVAAVAKALLQLDTNYLTLIVPEAVKGFLKEDQSLIGVAVQVREMANAAGVPLAELRRHLEEEFRESKGR